MVLRNVQCVVGKALAPPSDMFGHCWALWFAIKDKLMSVKKTLTNFLFLF